MYLCILIRWGSPCVGQVPVALECLPQDWVIRLLGYSPLKNEESKKNSPNSLKGVESYPTSQKAKKQGEMPLPSSVPFHLRDRIGLEIGNEFPFVSLGYKASWVRTSTSFTLSVELWRVYHPHRK